MRILTVTSRDLGTFKVQLNKGERLLSVMADHPLMGVEPNNQEISRQNADRLFQEQLTFSSLNQLGEESYMVVTYAQAITCPVPEAASFGYGRHHDVGLDENVIKVEGNRKAAVTFLSTFDVPKDQLKGVEKVKVQSLKEHLHGVGSDDWEEETFRSKEVPTRWTFELPPVTPVNRRIEVLTMEAKKVDSRISYFIAVPNLRDKWVSEINERLEKVKKELGLDVLYGKVELTG